MKRARILSGMTLLALSVGAAFAGTFEIDGNGNLDIDLGNASSRNSNRKLVLSPEGGDNLSYSLMGEDGRYTNGRLNGVTGDINIQSGWMG